MIYTSTVDLLFDVLIQKSCIPDHPLNAHSLSNILFQVAMPMRDSIWTTKISFNDYNVSKVIDWSWENSDKINDDTVELYELSLIWMLSSTNKYVRDASTKALASLFKQHPNTIISMLQKFESIDDPYILERLYAAVFGAVVRSENQEHHIEIAMYIYNEVFDQLEVYPHILLRDYARQTIEFILLTFELPEIDKENIQPPYKSIWYDHIPTNEEIDQLELEKIKGESPHKAHGIRRIISSMITEHGRGTGGYGDFGRYKFGSAVRAWENQFESDQELSNIAIKRIFEMGYDAGLHGSFDSRVGYYDRQSNTIERIGKKYQWIAFHELMAKLTDNFPTYREENTYTKEYEQYLTLKSVNFERFISGKAEIEIEKLDEAKHIEQVRKIPISQYSGPWEPFVRDIDPTFLIKDIVQKKYELIPRELPINPTTRWVKSASSAEDIKKYLEIEYENETYIALYSLFDWEYRKKNSSFSERDAKFFNASGLFVKNKDKQKILKDKEESRNGGLLLTSAYNIYAYEHYWSSSYGDFEEEYTAHKDHKEILACHSYLWEIDHSREGGEAAKYVLPSKPIVDYFGLVQIEEGFWQNENGKTLCFNTRLLGYDNCLLFKKDQLIDFLKEHDYSLLWKAYTEKVAKKYMNRCWYTVDYQSGGFEKYHVEEDVYRNEREW